MSGFQKPTDPVAELALRVRELEQKANAADSPKPFRIPVYAADPSTDDATNMWMLPDGRIRARHRNTADTAWVLREWVSTTPGGSGSGTAPAPPAPAPITRNGFYPAIWSQSYRQSGAARTDEGTVMLYYGSSGDAFNGMNRSLIGFNYTTIASDLAGSTVLGCWLYLVNIHAWFDAGSDIHFGVHNYTSEPSTWAGGGIPRSMVSKHHFGKPQAKTVPLPLYFATDIRDGIGKGVALESPSTSRSFYGYAAGFGSGYDVPLLTVQYAK